MSQPLEIGMQLQDILQLPFERLRAHAIDQLQLRFGATVLDVGCGSGSSFPALIQTIGPHGHLLGIERNITRLAHAQAKITRAQWQNIDLVAADATTTVLTPKSVDAVLILHANSIVLSPLAIEQIMGWLRPNGRFVAAGTQISYGVYRKLLQPIPITPLHSISTPHEDTLSWRYLRSTLSSFSVEEHFRGSMYLVSGVKNHSTSL
ncbi:MAG: hypothetical protein GFH27_549327n77 [Chloroflexi bacterium AL-W]|nr:hypothetical protein [Chloroflexi bacterium AL-N1]NOK69689.1 hypothetical protein [Chloroflexi bacterium AL-N10]NOK72236.1 hypothetical protein [Chloroflexi bacterium AL-N5]NOK85065.1 hypothetical protein [Chloroflexi bacterium AL-W]NOK91818.1 hypothetical protein [Chloroflexi bacterium AL-N15]